MIYEPVISSVVISANPVNINTAFTISVTVNDVALTLYVVSKVSGSAIAGEAVNPINTKVVAN